MQNAWLHRWIYYIASGLMFAAAALRSYLLYKDSPLLFEILLWLGGWLLMFLGNILLFQKLPWCSTLLIGLEVFLILHLLRISQADYFVFLFAIPCMQSMQQFTLKETSLWLGLTTLLTFLSLSPSFGILYAVGTAVVFLAGSVFLVIYIGATRRARFIQEQQQELVMELEQANRQLESYSQQLQLLAVGHERQRLARELHDSVTQTIFSMTLTTQSALILLGREPSKVAVQLERLNQLAHNSLAEMQLLFSELAPEKPGGFVSALKRHIEERRRLDNLLVELDLDGDHPLLPFEEQGLFRITQEALNNVVKHAKADHAVIHLQLGEQPYMEIEDHGIGFDPRQAPGQGRVGLVSMQERAVEIGWSLSVVSSPGNGTRVRVQKDSGDTK